MGKYTTVFLSRFTIHYNYPEPQDRAVTDRPVIDPVLEQDDQAAVGKRSPPKSRDENVSMIYRHSVS